MENKILLVVDIDQTIADNSHRVHLLPDWNAFFQECDKDIPIYSMIQAIYSYKSHEKIDMIFISSRSDDKDTSEKTRKWLDDIGFDNPLFLRPRFSKTANFKENALENYKRDEHVDVIIIDDEIKVIDRLKNKYKTILVKADNEYIDTIAELTHTIESSLKNLEKKSIKP